ncbi:MAG: hypothetical protein B6I20_13435 [Bacteroidetes bacterium 4572_117]|nr:MAG: hypothetical protein B6I20_13435 [Bacteroidetes bacterium 4572_117]
MEPTLNIKLNTSQIMSILQQLNIDERIAIFKEFSEEWLLLLGLNQPKPITIKEYNEKLEQGLKDFQEGKIVSHQEMKDEIHKWKTQKS